MPISSLQFNIIKDDVVTTLDGSSIGKKLGGNLIGLNNYCAIRVSHALISAGIPFDEYSDYKDKDGNKYIIKCTTMEKFLTKKFGEPTKVTNITAKGKKGIIIYSVSFSDATGHCDIWNGSTANYHDYFTDYGTKATSALLWEVK